MTDLRSATPARTRARFAATLALATTLVATVLPAGAVSPRPPGERAGAPASSQPEDLRDLDIVQRIGETLPLDLRLTDESGRAVELGEYFGERPVLVAMVYYECPMLCGLVMNGIVKAARALPMTTGQDYDVVVVSFDHTEGPELAAAKKRSVVAGYERDRDGRGWHFLTGDEAAVGRLADALGFGFRYVPEQDEYAHGAAVMVATPDGVLSRYFYGVEYSTRDLRLGLSEASGGKVGGLAEKLLLYCYRYDPSTGRYSAVAMAMVRAGGIATILAFGGFVAISRRRDRSGDPS